MSAALAWSLLAALLAGASALLAAQLYASWRVARWQAAETARLVRLAVFGPDPPAEEERRAVREALGQPPALVEDEEENTAGARVSASVAAAGDRLGPLGAGVVPVFPPAPSLDDVLQDALSRARKPDPALAARPRSATWADPPQGSARARRRPPSGG